MKKNSQTHCSCVDSFIWKFSLAPPFSSPHRISLSMNHDASHSAHIAAIFIYFLQNFPHTVTATVSGRHMLDSGFPPNCIHPFQFRLFICSSDFELSAVVSMICGRRLSSFRRIPLRNTQHSVFYCQSSCALPKLPKIKSHSLYLGNFQLQQNSH